MKSTAAVLESANSQLVIEEVDIAPLAPREVLVKMVGSGICHTDLGVIAAPGEGQTPIVLGHEGSGIVEQVGSEVTALVPGDRVVLSYNSCGRCDNCVGGVPQHCRDFLALNLVGSRLDGTSPFSRDGSPVLGAWFGQSSWAQRSVVTEQNAIKVDDDVPLELLGPLGCGIQTGAGAVLNTLDPAPGSSIAIFGAGSVGLAALLAAKVAECATIIAVDIQESRLAKAAELGATHTVNSSEVDAAEAIRSITGGLGVRYSVDCIGFPAVVRSALECLQTPGVCATVGFQGIPNEITIDHGQLLFGKSLIGVIEGDATPSEFIPRMLSLYKAGRFPFDKLIETFEFTDINKAIEAAHHGHVIKAVLTFGN
ncbi:NAD(P)-dependent alcohol dehydrogenase [Nocardia sp. NPDC050630]|uniref:NAD(P)-dependent alcohol dehydrogenase n=1 Tax=Nocardia sp. NPDC050630 TaxID=3364321 RepID=UPI00378CB996